MSIPSVPSIADVVKDYKGGAAVAAGEAFDPSPENLDARTTIVEQDGVRIAMLPKKNRGETVNMTLTLRYGNEESLKDNTVAASMLSSMLMAGTSKLDRQALQQEMDKLDVRIGGGFGGGGGRGRRGGGGGGGGGAGALSFSIEARKSSLEKGIMLLGQILRDPAFPETEFEQMKLRAVDGISRGETEPDALAAELMSRSLSQYPKGDVRYSPTMKESVEMAQAVTLDQVKDIYKKQLSAATGEIAIVGDFEPEAALSAIREVLHDWKSDVPYKPVVRDAKPDLKGSKNDIVTPDKANALFLAGLSFTMSDDDPDAIALQLGNFILAEVTYWSMVLGVVGILDTKAPVPSQFVSEGADVLLLGGFGQTSVREFGGTEYASTVIGSLWGMPPDFLATVAGYGADHEKQREEGRKLMKALGYSADKPLRIAQPSQALREELQAQRLGVGQVQLAAHRLDADAGTGRLRGAWFQAGAV